MITRVLFIAIFIQCCVVSPVRSSHDLNNYAHTTGTVDSGKSRMLPAWVITVIVLLILMALCFCIGICCYRFTCGEKYYGGWRRRIRTVRVTSSHKNYHINEHFQGTELTGVRISGENPINKEADKQVGQLSSTLYQSEAPPRYEDVVQAKNTELDKILNNQNHGCIRVHSTKSPPPDYQCINVVNV